MTPLQRKKALLRLRVYRWRFGHGWTLARIGEKVGRSPSAVSRHLSRICGKRK